MSRHGPERIIAGFGLAACLAALLAVAGSEVFLGLIPCAFCLIERKPWQAGAVVSLLALLLPHRAARVVLWGLVAVLLAASCLSFVHVGVEQHWWPDPLPACSAPDFSGMTMAQRLAAMPARPAKPCEDPDYLVPGLPVSMTQMAFLYALTVSAILAIWLSSRKGRRHR